MLKHKELINSERVLCRVWVRTKIINKIIFIISKAFIPNDSILVSCSNIIGYSDIRLGYAAIPVYCIGKNIKFDEIKKLMKWTLPKSSLLFTPEQI